MENVEYAVVPSLILGTLHDLYIVNITTGLGLGIVYKCSAVSSQFF